MKDSTFIELKHSHLERIAHDPKGFVRDLVAWIKDRNPDDQHDMESYGVSLEPFGVVSKVQHLLEVVEAEHEATKYAREMCARVAEGFGQVNKCRDESAAIALAIRKTPTADLSECKGTRINTN